MSSSKQESAAPPNTDTLDTYLGKQLGSVADERPDGVTGFSRINRRMHNKSFTVDNQVTLIGGRNIAGEYFGAREDTKFANLDVVGVGPVVQEVSSRLDDYWNHERAAPIESFAKMPEDPAAELEQVRCELDESNEQIRTTKYAAAVIAQELEYVESDTGVFTWAPYSFAVDSPNKSIKSEAATVADITTPLRAVHTGDMVYTLLKNRSKQRKAEIFI